MYRENENILFAGNILDKASKVLSMLHRRGMSAMDFVNISNQLNISMDDFSVVVP